MKKIDILTDNDFETFFDRQGLFTRNQLEEHLKLYNGYVERSNEYMYRYNSAKSGLALIGVKERFYIKNKETYDLDSLILHDLFIENLANPNQQENYMPEKLCGIFEESFGTVNNWGIDFKEAAKLSKGWALFVYEPLSDTYRNIILESHNEGIIIGAKILLVFDAYEHAYFIDFGANKKEYIEKFMQNINWEVVEGRL